MTYENLKSAIKQAIKQNGNQEITGALLQNTLLTIVSTVGKNATLAGVATPATNPGAPDGPVFYFANQVGTYSNFDGTILECPGLIVFYNTATDTWKSLKVYECLQELGNSMQFPVSQKVVNEALALKVDKESVIQDFGNSKNLVISQKAITDWINKGYQFRGIATPATNPGIPTEPMFYLTSEAGTYSNFDGIEVQSGETAILKWSKSWVKELLGFATNSKLVSLERTTLGDIIEKSAVVKQGNNVHPDKDFEIVQGGFWKKGTLLKLSTNSTTVEASTIYYAAAYPDGEKLEVVIQHKINQTSQYVLTDDCTRIRIWISKTAITGTGDVTLKIETVGLQQRTEGLENSVEQLKPQISKKQIRGSMSILGDSYSTYGLWIPTGNSIWYGVNGEDGHNAKTNNINSVTQTWWYKLCKKLDVSLMLNESYSGSTICNTGYNSSDSSGTSFIHRMIDSMGQGNALKPKPNIIILFGGTNDSWANSPLGELKYSNWTNDELKSVLPAICYMLYYVQKWNPGALILNVVNTELKQEIVNGFQQATQHYGIENIVLSEFGKENGHPNIDGMDSICNQIYNYIKNL